MEEGRTPSASYSLQMRDRAWLTCRVQCICILLGVPHNQIKNGTPCFGVLSFLNPSPLPPYLRLTRVASSFFIPPPPPYFSSTCAPLGTHLLREDPVCDGLGAQMLRDVLGEGRWVCWVSDMLCLLVCRLVEAKQLVEEAATSFFPVCRLAEAMQLAEEAGVSIDFEAVMQSG